MRRTKAGISVAVGLFVLTLTNVGPAQQQDPRVTDLIKKMEAQIEKEKTSYVELRVKVNVPGQPMPPFMKDGLLTYVWRDGDRHRAEVPHMNTVFVLSENTLKMYMGMANAALVVYPDAMAKIKNQIDEVCKGLGLPTDQDRMLLAMLEKGDVTISGEEIIDDVECWVIDMSLEAVKAFTDANPMANPMTGMPGLTGAGAGQVSFTGITMVVEKETATPRRMTMGMSMTEPSGVNHEMKIEIEFTVVDYDAEIPAGLFEFEIPEEATLVEWTADKSQEQVMSEFRAAVMQGAQQIQQPAQQGGGQ